MPLYVDVPTFTHVTYVEPFSAADGDIQRRDQETGEYQRYFPPANLDPKSAARFNSSRFCACPSLIPPLISFSLSNARLLGSSSFSFATADFEDLACSTYNDVERFCALYSAIRRDVSAASRSARSSLLLEMSSCAGGLIPMTSSSSRLSFCSGVSVHMLLSPPPPLAGGALAPLPVLNFRLRILVGSMREDQSDDVGGMSIHSSRWGLLAAAAAASCSSRRIRWRRVSAAVGVWVGREGPKSESESESESVGALGGSSDSGAGGRLGPRIRRRLGLSEVERVGGDGGLGRGDDGCSCSSCSQFRLAREGGSPGPTGFRTAVDMFGALRGGLRNNYLSVLLDWV